MWMYVFFNVAASRRPSSHIPSCLHDVELHRLNPLDVCLCVYAALISLISLLPPDAAGEHAALHRQRSLPHRPPVIPLVARMADQNTSGTPAMTEREASRLDKFKQLLAGPNTDLGKRNSPTSLHLSVLQCVLLLSSLVSLLLCLSSVALFLLFPELFHVFISLHSFASHSVCQLCRAFNNAAREKVIQPSGHADYKGGKIPQQQKPMTGLCSNQTTGLYCLSNPRDVVCYHCLPQWP